MNHSEKIGLNQSDESFTKWSSYWINIWLTHWTEVFSQVWQEIQKFCVIVMFVT